jgi:RimJ/RimL family protein N-acetyltransferase
MDPGRFRVAWEEDAGGAAEAIVAVEPAREEILARAPTLAAAYNDAHNSAMMANTIQFTAEDVVAHYARMAAEGARLFFLYEGTTFVGDADIRHIAGESGELAILVAARETQGRGLGTRFGILLHALAFRALGIARLYVTILPENAPSIRLFARLGHRVDTSSAARAYVDDERDVSMSLAKDEFERVHRDALVRVRISRE